MSKKILVAYGTYVGSTEGVAERIGKTLLGDDIAVDIKSAKQVSSLEGYNAVILGSAIRAGQLHADVLSFLKTFRSQLAALPVAYFVVCLTMQSDTPENRCTVEAYMNPAREAAPDVQPVGIGLFPGALDMKKLAFPLRLILKAMKAKPGDYRDMQKIDQWVSEIKPQLGV
jgi:menaquinone-dependent protoporphyrinogen oxidase